MMVSIKDIARAIGVSPSTVSRAWNNKPGVSVETRKQILRAIEELGYSPNELARGLKLQQSSTVGLVIPNIHNQVYAEIASSLENACTTEGYLVILCNSGRDPRREDTLLYMLRAKRVDGVVIIPGQEPLRLVEPLRRTRIPVVILEHVVPGEYCIIVDDLAGGRLGTQHLLDLGHRRIAMISRTRHSGTSALRVTGYRQVLEEAGISFDDELLVECESGHEAAYLAMRRLLTLDDPPTAVFTHNDVQALGALHAIQSAGLSVPGDISVVGFDDISSSAYFYPPLTTVRYPKQEVGKLAAETVLALVRGNDLPGPWTRILPVELVIRGSTAPCRFSPLSVKR
ncbi:MAG: LacI family DNA-binding transcriptional regulator [Anaerolineae bacterium]